MAKPHVLLTGPMMPLIEDGLAKHYVVHKLHEAHDRSQLITKIAPDVTAIATGGHTGVKCDEGFMAQFPRLKCVGNFGVGYDSIDSKAAAKRGVIVTNTPDVLTEEVADTTLGLLIMTVREFGKAEQYLRAGLWAKDGDYRLTPASLRDRRVGIVGMGRIGQAIAKRIEAFGMPISYFSRTPKKELSYKYYGNLLDMARDVDTLVVITPGGAETKNMINAEVLKALGSRGILINVARGTVVDEPALIAALKNKTIQAAGLDVFWNEPNVDPEFLKLDNVVLLPHVGSASECTRQMMGQLVVDNLAACAEGKTPPTPVPETPFKGW
ncbi:MAG TPA: 2-hydroxyacid dehydrogenase [Hyphomicrobiaceae bacterium]|nr:2-hydroxyacid dehydrogenase [Hyphomicrobiaceae bacterium]